MIRIHVLLLLAVLEVAAVFVGLWLWWFFKSRKQAQQIATMGPQTMLEAAPDAESYIMQELATTHEQMGVQSDTTPELSTAPLTLRAAYLDLEREFAQGQERDSEFWEGARQRLAALLEEFTPAAPVAEVSAEPDEDIFAEPGGTASAAPEATGEVNEAQRVKQLMESQVSTITELKDVLAAMVGAQERGPEVIEKVDKLGRASRELAMCVSILEDDNNHLRDRLTKAGILVD